jgi:hypothetical protein
MSTPAQGAEVGAVAAPDIEDPFVTAQSREVQRVAPDVDDGTLERVDRLASAQIPIVAVLLRYVPAAGTERVAHGSR